MKIYLCGPMTGLPQHNYPLFDRMAECFRHVGFEVVNPAETGRLMPSDSTWDDYMANAMEQLRKCDAVVCLPGWQSSKGARREVMWAECHNMDIRDAAWALRNAYHWREHWQKERGIAPTPRFGPDSVDGLLIAHPVLAAAVRILLKAASTATLAEWDEFRRTH